MSTRSMTGWLRTRMRPAAMSATADVRGGGPQTSSSKVCAASVRVRANAATSPVANLVTAPLPSLTRPTRPWSAPALVGTGRLLADMAKLLISAADHPDAVQQS
jgi:hypothetical protein